MLAITAQEYYANLYQLQDENAPSMVELLPGKNNVYNVDLNTRTIQNVPHLGVIYDHNSKIVYFKVARYFDNQDLAKTTCVIQYTSAGSTDGIYPVPFYDPFIYEDEQCILLPWVISGEVTEAAGNVQFSIRFFMVDEDKTLLYNISTLTATSRVLPSINLTDELKDKYNINATILDTIVDRMADYARQYDMTWLDLSQEQIDLAFTHKDPQYVLATGHKDFLEVYYALDEATGEYSPVHFNRLTVYEPNKYYVKRSEVITASFNLPEGAKEITLTNSVGYLMNVYLYQDGVLIDTRAQQRNGSRIVIPTLDTPVDKIEIDILTNINPRDVKGTCIIAK